MGRRDGAGVVVAVGKGAGAVEGRAVAFVMVGWFEGVRAGSHANAPEERTTSKVTSAEEEQTVLRTKLP